jgi:hypothetical protein
MKESLPMLQSCDTLRYALATTDLARMARQLGYERLASRIARHPRSPAAHRLARQLAFAAMRANHEPHALGACRRHGTVGDQAVVLMTVPDGARHRVISARPYTATKDATRIGPSISRLDPGSEEGEALFDLVVG